VLGPGLTPHQCEARAAMGPPEDDPRLPNPTTADQELRWSATSFGQECQQPTTTQTPETAFGTLRSCEIAPCDNRTRGASALLIPTTRPGPRLGRASSQMLKASHHVGRRLPVSRHYS